jgi:hypothetical protein
MDNKELLENFAYSCFEEMANIVNGTKADDNVGMHFYCMSSKGINHYVFPVIDEDAKPRILFFMKMMMKKTNVCRYVMCCEAFGIIRDVVDSNERPSLAPDRIDLLHVVAVDKEGNTFGTSHAINVVDVDGQTRQVGKLIMEASGVEGLFTELFDD